MPKIHGNHGKQCLLNIKGYTVARLCSVVWWHKNHTTLNTPHCMSPHHTILKNQKILKGKNDLLFQILANNDYFLKSSGKYCWFFQITS